ESVSSDYLYEPAPRPAVETLLLRYVESMLYQAVVENDACEQCARMFAMQTATDNADRVLRDLRRLYQKTRQAQITTELCEIVAGAAAV
ncbi:TPA: F0F1 ATP synthase subunit gamma, partial [Burkholderia vietnamiensis]|nr:F0F1 ATP synthase subunit gamma [Burkholderia vietnamiensis]